MLILGVSNCGLYISDLCGDSLVSPVLSGKIQVFSFSFFSSLSLSLSAGTPRCGCSSLLSSLTLFSHTLSLPFTPIYGLVFLPIAPSDL